MILGALTLAVIGGAILVRRRRSSVQMTVASRLLGALARAAAPEAEEWPLAMLAEHDAIEEPGERARFARGAVLAVLRRGPSRRSLLRADLLADAACVAIAAALAVVSLVRYPGLRVGTTWMLDTGLFVLGLAIYATGALVVSRFGTRPDHLVGALVGLSVLVLGVFAASFSGQAEVWLVSLVVLFPAIAVLIDRLVGRARDHAWVAGTTCALTSGLGFFVGFVTATLATDGGHPTRALTLEAQQSGIRPFSAWAVGDALGGASFMLVYVLIVGMLVGVGTALAAARRAS